MIEESTCGRLPLGLHRRLVNDLCYFAAGVPLFPLEREFDLRRLSELRAAAEPRIGWPALFLKAYGLLSAEHPALRQCYLPWPWPHLYQHAQSVAMLAINRQTPAGDRLCWGRFIAPENESLVSLQASLDAYQREPVNQIFRRQVRLSRLPWPVRRLAWWLGLNAFGSRRAKRFGTFGLSTVAGLGAVNRFHPSCLTSSLSFGPLSAEGRALVTIVCDHRVVDGAPMARALADLEEILRGPVASELAGLCACAAA